MGVKDAQKAVEQAQAAYSANKEDKALKKAVKAAKAELAAQQAKEAEPHNVKKRKGDDSSAEAPAAAEKPRKLKKARRLEEERQRNERMEALQFNLNNAKSAYKTDKTIANKQKVKEAREAIMAAEGAAAPKPAETSASAPAPPPTPASTPASSPSDVLSSLKSNRQEAPTTEKKGPDNPPCNRVFVGNLSWDVNDDLIKEFFADCGNITKISWINDKVTERFKGCGVLDFEDVESATKAVAKQNQLLLERPVVVQFSKASRTPLGTDRPPVDDKQKRFVDAPLAPKPAGCLTCFLGNLAFNVEEDEVRKFAEECGEITSIRWVYNKETGEWKGCGFVDFAETEAVDKFVAKRGAILKGRPVRIDYSGAPPRAGR